METLTAGTIEYLRVTLEDRNQEISELPSSLTYTVKDSAGTDKYTNQAGSRVGMTAYCLMDTTGWAADEYRLYISFPLSPETPKIGPVRFRVDDG